MLLNFVMNNAKRVSIYKNIKNDLLIILNFAKTNKAYSYIIFLNSDGSLKTKKPNY